MTSLVLPDDIAAALLRPLTDTETLYIAALIRQASSLLRQAAPSVDQRIAAYTADATDPEGLDPQLVATVLAGVIKRYLINPTGIASESQTNGPFSQSTSYALRSEKESRGVLQVTELDLTVLFPNRKRLRAGTIKVRPALAPRPVGRYGPLPTLEEAVNAAIDYSPSPTRELLTEDPLLDLE